MADYDIHIKGGTVVDGTRAPRYHGDIWIRDGKVAQIGGRSPGFAKKTIDADGLIVAVLRSIERLGLKDIRQRSADLIDRARAQKLRREEQTEGTFTISATASSGLTVSFHSQTMPVCTVSGATVTLIKTGTCTIQATQAGNTDYTAAAPVDQSFQVTP